MYVDAELEAHIDAAYGESRWGVVTPTWRDEPTGLGSVASEFVWLDPSWVALDCPLVLTAATACRVDGVRVLVPPMSPVWSPIEPPGTFRVGETMTVYEVGVRLLRAPRPRRLAPRPTR